VRQLTLAGIGPSMHKLTPLLLAALPACLAARPPLERGELEGLTIAEAAERIGKGPARKLTDCEKECLAFSVEGCADITMQCDDGTGTNFAFAGAYVTDCDTAKRPACGTIADTHSCVVECGGWLGRVLDNL
jgi:hypothetical protein